MVQSGSFVAILILQVVPCLLGFEWATLSKLDHFVKKPSEGIYVGGRITTRQIQALSDAGFKSILSISNFTDDDASYNSIAGDFPSSANEENFAKSIGLQSIVVESQLTLKSLDDVSKVLYGLPKPLYVHCHVGWSASLFTTLYLYTSGSLSPNQVIDKGLQLGWNFRSNADAVALINAVTDLNITITTSPVIERPLTDEENSYKSFYWPHRLNDFWYNMGQPLETHVEVIAAAGYKTVVSLRNNGEATTRLSTDATTGPIPNQEFSDSNGNYNVTAEANGFFSHNVEFLNMPVTGDASWTDVTSFINTFVPAMQRAESRGPVLAHCASGYRSAAYVSTYLAYTEKKCSAWALEQSALVGFTFTVNEADKPVVDFMVNVLGC